MNSSSAGIWIACCFRAFSVKGEYYNRRMFNLWQSDSRVVEIVKVAGFVYRDEQVYMITETERMYKEGK